MKLDLQELSPEAIAVVDAELKTFQPQDSEEKRIFRAALALIRNEETWAQRDYKRYLGRYYKQPAFNVFQYDAVFPHISLESEDRYAYCSMGAIFEVTGDCSINLYSNNPGGRVLKALSETVWHLVGSKLSVWEFNDNSSHSGVIRMWEHTGKREGWL